MTQHMALGVRLFGQALRMLRGGVAGLDAPALRRLSATSRLMSPILRVITGFPRRGVKITEGRVMGRSGRISVRIYRPRKRESDQLPFILNIHGGGWVIGGRYIADWIASSVARDLHAVVVSVDYRLAPEHPFPAAIEDCLDVMTWMASNAAELGASVDRLAVMGESAGGNLAAVLCIMARDGEGPAIRHQTLMYPATDLRGVTASRRDHANALILTAADLDGFVDAYVGGRDPDSDWRMSPLRASRYDGLPPALVQVAGHDPLRDEGVAYAEALAGGGGEVTLTCYEAMPHGFINLPYISRDARRAIREVVTAQRRHL